jgi:hypothetical protein
MPVRAAMILLGIPSSHRIINPDPQQASREEVSSLSLVLTVPGDRDAEYRACTLKCLICDKSQAAAAHLPAPVRPIARRLVPVASKVPKYLTIRTHTSTSHPTTASLRRRCRTAFPSLPIASALTPTPLPPLATR